MTDNAEAEAVKASAFDFDDLRKSADAHNQGIEFELLGPKGQLTGVFFTVSGFESERYRKAQFEIRRRQVSEKIIGEQTFERSEADQIAQVAPCVISWRTGDDSYVLFQGEKLDCTIENIKRLLVYALVRDQVFLKVYDALGFTKG